MAEDLVITLREGSEAALVAGIILAYLAKPRLLRRACGPRLDFSLPRI